jgi:hypothetical protein
VTIHPSALLLLQDEEEERASYASFRSIIPPIRQTQVFAPLSSVLLCLALVLDLSVRSVVSPFVFLMPTAGAVFVLDRDALPWRSLLVRCSFRGRVSRLAGGKRLGEDVADFLGPTPVVLDDRVRKMPHGLNLLLIAPAPTRPTTLGPSGGFVAVSQWRLMARGRRTRLDDQSS